MLKRTKLYTQQVEDAAISIFENNADHRGPELAEKFFSAVEELEQDIEKNPTIGWIEIEDSEIRSRRLMPYGWRLYFEADGETITLLYADHQRDAGAELAKFLESLKDSKSA